jgi:hypothetical protein
MIDTEPRGFPSMRRVLGACAAAAAVGALAVGPAVATQPDTVATGAYVEAGHKITICHRTGADEKYVVITIDVAAVDGVGGTGSDHRHHEKVGNGPGGDVIPPVTIDGVYFDGKNWDDNWMPGDEVTPDDCEAPQSS